MKKPVTDPKKLKLDPEEKELLESVERGEWTSAKMTKAEWDRYINFASNTMRKNKVINIRISQNDLRGIQLKAVKEGIPYQTLITSVLHKFASGQAI